MKALVVVMVALLAFVTLFREVAPRAQGHETVMAGMVDLP